jgi:multisubunit Na+/H+ antiporter MnhG subunit
MTESSAPNRYESYASIIAPAAAGVALGMLFGREMERKTSNVVALTLLAASAVVAAPVVTDIIQRAANRPGTKRGSRRRLQGIRDGALPVPETDEFFTLDDDLLPAKN